jgi:hypothetical protein
MKNLKKISREGLKSVKGGYTQEHTQICHNLFNASPCIMSSPDANGNTLGCRVGGACVSAYEL